MQGVHHSVQGLAIGQVGSWQGALLGRQALFAVHLLAHLPAKATQGYGMQALGRPLQAGFE